jgi:ankyrin repeat protein
MKNIKGYTEHLREANSMETPERLGQRLRRIIDNVNPDIEEVKRLIQAGANLKTRDKYGLVPLHLAAILGHIEIAKALIEAGADPEERTVAGWTPIDYATLHVHKDLARLLIEVGAGPSSRFDSLDDLENYFGGDTSWIPQESLPPEWRKRNRARGAFGRF